MKLGEINLRDSDEFNIIFTSERFNTLDKIPLINSTSVPKYINRIRKIKVNLFSLEILINITKIFLKSSSNNRDRKSLRSLTLIKIRIFKNLVRILPVFFYSY